MSDTANHLLTAYADGTDARADGAPATPNPHYTDDPDDIMSRAMAGLWLRGWLRGAPDDAPAEVPEDEDEGTLDPTSLAALEAQWLAMHSSITAALIDNAEGD